MRKTLIIWVLISCQVLTVTGQENMDIFLKNPMTKYANIGILIKNVQTGLVIADYRSHNVIPPASVIKILTTATALELLGSDYRYPTYLEYSGYIESGTLHGDLYVVGQGDPTLGSQKDGTGFFRQWTEAVRKAGIEKIDGRVIADLSYFDGDAFNPGWLLEDAGNYYAPGIFAISYMDNTMNIVLESGQPGTVARVAYTVPDVPGMTWENHIRCTHTEEDGAFVYGLPYSNQRYLTGSVPSKRGTFGIKGDLPNPGLLLAQHFTERLRNAGIPVKLEASYHSESDLLPRTRIHTHLSEPLGDIAARTNQHSINLFAESIYRQLGSRLAIPCSVHNAEMVVRNCWRNRGVDLTSATIKDGCGLAPQDAISAASLVQLLEYMWHSPNKDVFFASLPVSGKSGTLRSFLAGTELVGHVYAKSGTIGGTKNFAGYIELPNGQQWAFAVMVNGASCKGKNIQPIIAQYLFDVYRRNK